MIYNQSLQNGHLELWDSYFMSLAILIYCPSCSRLHVGCVLVKDTRVISVGYNGFLPSLPHKKNP